MNCSRPRQWEGAEKNVKKSWKKRKTTIFLCKTCVFFSCRFCAWFDRSKQILRPIATLTPSGPGVKAQKTRQKGGNIRKPCFFCREIVISLVFFPGCSMELRPPLAVQMKSSLCRHCQHFGWDPPSRPCV